MVMEYQITNFKAFAGPETIPIKPITLIFGPNSSGKSAILQSLLMLKQTLDESMSSKPTLLAKGNLVDLGSYQEFIHGHDIGNSFSFKIIFQRPEDIGEILPIEDYIMENRQYHPSFEILNEQADFDKFGLGIAFSLDSNWMGCVSKIDLYLGTDTYPIISYVNEPPGENAEKQVQELYKENPTTFFRVKHCIIEKLSNLPEEEGRAARDILEILGMNFDPKEEFILLKNFLPELLNGKQTQYIIHEDFNHDGVDADNISLFGISISYLLREFFDQLIYIAPLRNYPERYFSFSGIDRSFVGKAGQHLQDILINNEELLGKVNEQFSKFNINYELGVFRLSNNDLNIKNLYTIRLIDKSTPINVSITDVGFGLSQVLPIIVQSLISKGKNILIEQPELHLHPALQAELGDLFINSALGNQNNTFIIETHSEHLILRVLRRIRETSEGELPEGIQKITPSDIAVIYVQPTKEGSKIIHIPVTEEGEFEKSWPEGFFAERAKELF